MSLLVYLLSLPLAVTTIAAVFALVDYADKPRALLLVSLRLLLTCVVLLIVGAQHQPWVGAAFVTVGVLHLGAFAWSRQAITSGRWISEKIE